jgi:predicted HicB family RNase H-like nuclease
MVSFARGDKMKKKFTTTLDNELIKQAKIKSIELNISVAELIEKLLRDFLEKK